MTELTEAITINELGEQYGKQLANAGFSKTQMQRIYIPIKEAQRAFENDTVEKAKTKLELLKPLLARQHARHSSSDDDDDEEGVKTLKDVFDAELGDLQDENTDLTEFFRLMEATMAYHYYYINQEEDS